MAQAQNNAKLTVLLHAGHIETKGCRSLLGELRPFSGIHESDFRDLYDSLIVLHASLTSDELDRELVYACWDLCTRIRFLAPTLIANQLIDTRQEKRLTAWGHCVDSYCRRCFHQLPLVDCMSNFLEYVASDLCPSPHLYRSLLPTLNEGRADADFELRPLLDDAIRAID
jgi:hypothetical protein